MRFPTKKIARTCKDMICGAAVGQDSCFDKGMAHVDVGDALRRTCCQQWLLDIV